MEPPTKRPRLGPPPSDNYDDPEADELNERPEDVNARRDPAAQLERSRAFAAFKLKSAFERIFEKYDKDFTGVSDEIDLRTGEIVVDNGHVQSLVGAQLGGAEDGEGSEDGASEVGSLNEEERMIRGQVDNRLSRVGQDALPSMPPQIGAPPFPAGGWPGPAPTMGGPPGFPGMMYPVQINYGGFPMQYGTPISIPTTDPTWSTPALPPPFVRNALTSGGANGSIRKKAARLSLSAAREQDGGDEDDIFLDASAVGEDEGKAGAFAMKQKVLLAHPPPEKALARKKKSPGMESKRAQKAGKLGKHQKAKKSPAKKESLESTPAAQPDPTPEGASTEPGPRSVAPVELSGSDTASTPASGELTATNMLVADETTKEVREDDPGKSETVHIEPRLSTGREVGLELDREHPDVYVNLSDEGEKLTRRPRNQILQIEIPAMKPYDVRSFRIITPEPSQADFSTPQDAIVDGHSPKQATAVLEAQNMTGFVQDRDRGPRSGGKPQETTVEIFSRNNVDPAYAFSDEDEPTLPLRKVQRKPNKPKLVKPTNTEPAVLREISQNVSSGMASCGRELVPNTPAKEVDESTAARAPSPTLSLHLDDVQDYHGNLSGSLEGGGVTETPLEPSVAEIPNKIGDKEAAASSQITERRMTRRMSMHNAGNLPFVLPGPEATLSKASRRRRSSKVQPSETPNKTPGKLDIYGSRSLAPPRRHEIPETSPNAQPAVSPLPANSPPAPASAIQDSDPPFSPEEQTQDISDQRDRAPSPTLTDPSSKPQPTIPRPRSAPKKTTTTVPHTPMKTPTRRRPKSHHQKQQPPPSTNPPPPTTTSTPIHKRKGLLSLLRTNSNGNASSEDDELSILTPAKPPGTALRSTPASHHVRLGLLTTAKSTSSTSTKLKRAVLKGSVSAGKASGGGAVQTPTTTTTRGRGRRKSGVGVGLDAGPPRTPSSRMALLQESELVQTPGGTMRRCGEDGFRCEREFCFSCL